MEKNDEQNRPAEGLFAFTVDLQNVKSIKRQFYAPTELERDEWVYVIRKYSTQSNIENAYKFTRDATSKLGEGANF